MRTGDGREGTWPSQEEVEPIPGSPSGRIPACGLAGRNAGSHLCWVQPPGMAVMGTGSWSGRWGAGCEGYQPCASGSASCPAREVWPAGATSVSMSVPLHKPHASEEGRAVSDEAWGGTARWGPDLQPALGSWGPSSPVGAQVFTCMMPQLLQDSGREVDSCSQARSLTCLGKRTLRGWCPAWRGGQAGSTGWEQDSEGKGARTEVQTHQPSDASQAVRGRQRARPGQESRIGDGALEPPRAGRVFMPCTLGPLRPAPGLGRTTTCLPWVEVGPGW